MDVEQPIGDGSAGLPCDLVGPVLVLADAEAIGRLAPGWAVAFAAAGLRYRVRLVRGDAPPCEIDAVVAEVRRQAARSCAVAGDAAAVATARAVAARAAVPCIVLESRPAGLAAG